VCDVQVLLPQPRWSSAPPQARSSIEDASATQGPGDGDSDAGSSLDDGTDTPDAAEKGQAAQQRPQPSHARRPTWRAAITAGLGRVGTRARKAWLAARPLPAEREGGADDPPDAPRRPVDQFEWVRHRGHEEASMFGAMRLCWLVRLESPVAGFWHNVLHISWLVHDFALMRSSYCSIRGKGLCIGSFLLGPMPRHQLP